MMLCSQSHLHNMDNFLNIKCGNNEILKLYFLEHIATSSLYKQTFEKALKIITKLTPFQTTVFSYFKTRTPSILHRERKITSYYWCKYIFKWTDFTWSHKREKLHHQNILNRIQMEAVTNNYSPCQVAPNHVHSILIHIFNDSTN